MGRIRQLLLNLIKKNKIQNMHRKIAPWIDYKLAISIRMDFSIFAGIIINEV